ncbi:MAG TPA: Type 1 glutamine amidotransferase-like domain-containing protein [Dietzia timorensis]|uniref:Type 1 glutamine amidotransferase-like domain-containing protein n=1 Tax=Dietzia timorensis TaxID=499555 RepID=A0A921F2D0_9ACTN|nr:Type 1 glutamine amidotransferase-like domain-containing protein [Dietzia timorensis]HJE90506.1 Type 1 glutamine amidotransferase-like domain-containing protein [Dietzia timorensis]
MKLLLTSLGVGAIPSFVEGATGRAPEGLRLGFVWDAAAAEAQDPEGQWQLDRLEALGFTVTRILASDATSAESFSQTLSRIDVVYLAGGNSFALLAALRGNGSGQALVAAVRAGLPYIGMSAGSVVAGTDLDPITLLDDTRAAPGLDGYAGLGLVPHVVVPHADGKLPDYPPAIFERIDREYESRFPLLFLDDDEALMVSGGSARIVESP